jgi:hypothetical protein
LQEQKSHTDIIEANYPVREGQSVR